MPAQDRAARLIAKGTGCSKATAAGVARALGKAGLLATYTHTGYLVEWHNAGRWWRVNEWIYGDKTAALGLAERLRDDRQLPCRVVEVSHTNPRVVRTFKLTT